MCVMDHVRILRVLNVLNIRQAVWFFNHRLPDLKSRRGGFGDQPRPSVPREIELVLICVVSLRDRYGDVLRSVKKNVLFADLFKKRGKKNGLVAAIGRAGHQGLARTFELFSRRNRFGETVFDLSRDKIDEPLDPRLTVVGDIAKKIVDKPFERWLAGLCHHNAVIGKDHLRLVASFRHLRHHLAAVELRVVGKVAELVEADDVIYSGEWKDQRLCGVEPEVITRRLKETCCKRRRSKRVIVYFDPAIFDGSKINLAKIDDVSPQKLLKVLFGRLGKSKIRLFLAPSILLDASFTYELTAKFFA